MKSTQRGEGLLGFLAAIVLAIGCIYWGLQDFLPAQAEDVQEVVLLAEKNTEAQAAVVTSLKESPNPSRAELRQLRSRINEIMVTEIARSVTGDKTIKAPNEIDAIHEQQEANRLSVIDSKSWGEMNKDERAEFMVGMFFRAIAVIAFVWAVQIGYRRAQRGY